MLIIRFVNLRIYGKLTLATIILIIWLLRFVRWVVLRPFLRQLVEKHTKFLDLGAQVNELKTQA